MGSLYRSQHELCPVFRNGKVSHQNNIQLGRFGRNRTNVWNYPAAMTTLRQSEEPDLLALHPTIKPTSMIADAILDYSKQATLSSTVFSDPARLCWRQSGSGDSAMGLNWIRSTLTCPFVAGNATPGSRQCMP